MAIAVSSHLSRGIFLFFFFMSMFSPSSYAEGNIDMIKRIWTNPSESDSNRFNAIDAYYLHYAYAYPDSVLALSMFHYDLAKQKNSREEMAEALDTKALAYHLLGKYDSAISVLQITLTLVKKFKDPASLARIYANMGSNYRSNSKYQEAVRNYESALEILQEEDKEFEQAEVLNNLGLVYYDIERYDLALDYLNEALKLYRKLEIQDNSGNIWLNIGAVYFEQGDYDTSKTYCQKALEILQANNHYVAIADGYWLLAKIYQQAGKIDTAIQYINKSLRINQEIGNEGEILGDLVLLANLTLDSDVATATEMGEKMLGPVEDISDATLKKNVFKLMYTCYKKQKNYPLALTMHEKYKTYADSVQLEENTKAIIREAIQSEFEFKLLKNQHENEQVQAQLKLNQLQERYAIILIGIALIAIILFYSRSRMISHRKQQEVLLAEIEQLKSTGNASMPLQTPSFQLDRTTIEESIDRKVNETDWKVLNILLDDPVTSNKEIAELAHLSVDGIGSSLRRMYIAFEIKESKYKKISLIMKAIKLSNK